MREIAFVFEKIVLCSECALKIEEQRRKKEKTNIHVEHLRFNIVFYHDIDNFLNKIKTKIINKDANSTSDVLLIIDTLLIIDDSRYEFKNKLIFAICQNDEKMIYVNNNFFSKTFFKLVINYIFKMNCDC